MPSIFSVRDASIQESAYYAYTVYTVTRYDDIIYIDSELGK